MGVNGGLVNLRLIESKIHLRSENETWAEIGLRLGWYQSLTESGSLKIEMHDE